MFWQVRDLDQVVSQSSPNKSRHALPVLGEDKKEYESPTKKKSQSKKKRQCKSTEGLTAEEQALDDSSNNGDNNREAPNQSNKGKWKASNAYKINPKSCGTPQYQNSRSFYFV